MPGVKLNFSKRGVSTTFGVKGARYTMGSGGRRTASVGIPGTGISYVTTRNKHTARKVSQNAVGYYSKTTTLILCLMFGLLGVHRFYVGKKRNWYTLVVLCWWFYYWLDNRRFGNIKWKIY